MEMKETFCPNLMALVWALEFVCYVNMIEYAGDIKALVSTSNSNTTILPPNDC